MPYVANIPAFMSAIGTPTFTGGESGTPVKLIKPLIPWAMRSKPARFAYGPVLPKPEIEQ